jgi:hypothetical protein
MVASKLYVFPNYRLLINNYKYEFVGASIYAGTFF